MIIIIELLQYDRAITIKIALFVLGKKPCVLKFASKSWLKYHIKTN